MSRDYTHLMLGGMLASAAFLLTPLVGQGVVMPAYHLGWEAAARVASLIGL